MAVFTREQKARQIAVYQEALEAVAANQEYRIGSRTYRSADLAEIRATLDWLDAQPTVEDARAGKAGPRFATMLPNRGHGGF